MHIPQCYGRHWSPTAAECAGGLDPVYESPVTGANKREKCSWFSGCAAATNEKGQMTPKPQVPQLPGGFVRLPVHPPPQPPQLPQHLRPQVPPPPPPHVQHVQPPQQYVQPPHVQQYAQPHVQQYVQPPQQPVQPPQQPVQPSQVVYVGNVAYAPVGQASTPHMVPMNTPMTGAQVPSFLTVPEPSGQEYGVGLAHNLWRSMLKAAFLTAANYIDYNPVGR